jgi:hypothetical protein
MDLEAEIMAHAEMVFDRNMDRRGFSFTPFGLYRAAFDSAGRLKKNWRLAMRQHQPQPAEHPKLYEPPRCLGERRKMNG